MSTRHPLFYFQEQFTGFRYLIPMNMALLNLVVTSILTGLIWTIQVVHYPSFIYLWKGMGLKQDTNHIYAGSSP